MTDRTVHYPINYGIESLQEARAKLGVPDMGRYSSEQPNTKLPPTPKQLERLYEYMEHPSLDTADIDKLTREMDQILKTRGGVGATLGWIKAKIRDWEDSLGNTQSRLRFPTGHHLKADDLRPSPPQPEVAEQAKP